jgi:protocatechuate 3,4-dioxygenase, alpha subunit
MTINLITPSQITPSQTVGPFFAYGLTSKGKYPFEDVVHDTLLTPDVTGEKITITGVLTDGNGNPINDGMIELWQADAGGVYNNRNSSFKGIGRAATNDAGEYSLTTIKPGSVKGQAPVLNIHVLARGVLRHLYTKAYFAGEALNANDAVLNLVPAERRETLMLKGNAPHYRFDISIQGANETVFFEVA